jgi:hypothetical protein
VSVSADTRGYHIHHIYHHPLATVLPSHGQVLDAAIELLFSNPNQLAVAAAMAAVSYLQKIVNNPKDRGYREIRCALHGTLHASKLSHRRKPPAKQRMQVSEVDVRARPWRRARRPGTI